jgi:adenine-specific DNA-methyltransferase
LLSVLEQNRLRISRSTSSKKKSEMGQFFTPVTIAKFMAGLFSDDSLKDSCHLLDPGAGIGSLSCAFMDRCVSDGILFKDFNLSAFELDESLYSEMKESFSYYSSQLPLNYNITGGDFIEKAADMIHKGYTKEFTHVIMNPPYKKIDGKTHHRYLLSSVGIETVNLYSAFVSLALEMMRPMGQLVAIIPRSFCNGPYYRSFRNFLLKRATIKHIHLFESRNSMFKDDSVLQENVIILLEKGGKQDLVKISCSTDDSFSDIKEFACSFKEIVSPLDSERFINIPVLSDSNNSKILGEELKFNNYLKDIGVEISTGPVVDFRLKEHLRQMPEQNTVPLLYPNHFQKSEIQWPQLESKKPNAIVHNSDTERWLFPKGCYCIVRRISSKEEKRRIVANFVNPDYFRNIDAYGFENHLNVFHENKQGLSQSLAKGLTVYLNSTFVDDLFRKYSGHTQVNATDLRQLKYPSRMALIKLGEKIDSIPADQSDIDNLIKEMEL